MIEFASDIDFEELRTALKCGVEAGTTAQQAIDLLRNEVDDLVARIDELNERNSKAVVLPDHFKPKAVVYVRDAMSNTVSKAIVTEVFLLPYSTGQNAKYQVRSADGSTFSGKEFWGSYVYATPDEAFGAKK